MAEREIETINHLLEVERNAQNLIKNAQVEADKRLSVAKAEAEKKFRAAFEKSVAEQERLFEEKTAKISADTERAISDFRSRISQTRIEKASFDSFLNSVLFA